MARTAQQQCYEVVVVKNTLQRTLDRVPTSKDISEMLHRNIKLTDGMQDDYIENFVQDVMTIHERLLSAPSLAHIIVEQENRDGQNSLWNNIGKLAVLDQKLQTMRK